MGKSDEGPWEPFRPHVRIVGGVRWRTRMPLEIGASVDRYRVESLIGRGGVGQGYRAVDTRPPRPIALKLLHESLSAEAMSRLVREARLAASLSHPNIVAVFDVGEHEGVPFMA